MPEQFDGDLYSMYLSRSAAYADRGFHQNKAYVMLHSMPGEIVTNQIDNKSVSFLINNPEDIIQKHHKSGEFYELEELGLISDYIRPGSTFLDIGANVGNHSLYALLFRKVGRVIAFEPNPNAYRILRANIALNGAYDRFTHYPIGLSDRSGLAMMTNPPNNLGGSSVTFGSVDGEIPILKGDDLLSSEKIDFIKMDVEGLEVAALTGLETTIARNMPPMFIEIDDHNREKFLLWVSQNDYKIINSFRRYILNENFLIVKQ